MQNAETHTQHLVHLQQMTDVGAGIAAAGRAVTGFGNGAGIGLELFVQNGQLALPGKEVAVTCITAGHDAVEEIHPAAHGLENVLRCADTHEITGAVGRHMRLHRLDGGIHFLGRFAYGKAADGVAVAVHFGDPLHVIDTEILVGTTLIDAEEKLVFVDGFG